MFKWQTLKAAFSVVISTARHISEQQALSIKEPYLQIFEDRLIMCTDPGFLLKVSLKFHRSQEIALPSFCMSQMNTKEAEFHQLDVKACILHYLEVSRGIRNSNALFILPSGCRVGLQASKNMIVGWIKQAIMEAYKILNKEFPLGSFCMGAICLLGKTSWGNTRTNLSSNVKLLNFH